MRRGSLLGCTVLWGALLGCGSQASPPTGAAAPAAAAPADLARLGAGFAVWESKRTGDWRIWMRRFDGSPPRQLSPDDGRQHCCPHVSPDGRRLVYLARLAGRDRYPEQEVAGPLRLVDLASGEERTLAAEARTYGWGNRCAVWRDDRELIHVAGDGSTRLLDLESGGSRPLTDEPRTELGWLIDATLSFATHAGVSFSPYRADARRVLERGTLGGCEPYFSQDGRWGYWIGGAGGPVHRIDLATGAITILLRKNDPRMPGEQGYVYFPMFSRDGRLFAFGASDDEHNHFQSNYDVYVAPSDPRTLELVGDPVRVTDDPASDRYPDVFLESPGPAFEAAAAAPPSVPPAFETGDGEPSWPSDRRGLVFLWQTAERPNLVPDPELDAERAYPLTAHGRARLDRHFAMVLDGGSFEAPPDAAAALLAAVQASNELTLEATVTSAVPEQSGPARIVTFSSNLERRNLTLGQEGRELVLRLRTNPTGPNADRPQVRLFEIDAGEPVHVTVTYSPGVLHVYRDGEPVAVRHEIYGTFQPWAERRLLFGDEAGGGADWSGTLEGVALYDRVLEPAEVRANHKRYRRTLDERQPVARLEVRATLRARSRIPTLDDISPYRQALAVFEWTVDEVVAGPAPSGVLRVAHWVILDGETLEVAGLPSGASARLALEPFDAQPQLESHYLSDTLDERLDLELYHDVR